MNHNNDIYLDKEEDALEVEEWREKGAPRMWLLKFDKVIEGRQIKIWSDMAYANLMIEVDNKRTIQNGGWVLSEDQTVVAFTETYSPAEPYVPYILHK